DLMNRTMPPDIGSASALLVLLLIIVCVLLYFFCHITRNAEEFATVTGKNFRPHLMELGRWRPVAGGVLLLNFILLLVLPTLILAWASLLPFYQTIRASAFPLLTLENYARVLSSTRYLTLLTNTLIAAVVTAT